MDTTTQTESDRSDVLAGLSAEVVFAILPLIILLLVLLYTKHATHLLASPEWSFGAAILLGQAMVKFVCGLARAGAAATGHVALVVTLVFVFGLAPCLIILFMMLHLREYNLAPGHVLQGMQVFFFVAASATYIILGTIGEQWRGAE